MSSLEHGRFNPDGTLIDAGAEWTGVKNKFDSYFADAEIGSAKVLALYDYVELVRICDRVQRYRDYITELKVNPDTDLTKYAHPISYRSELRVEEQLLVGIELRIQERMTSVPGYYLHQTRLGDFAEDMNAVLFEKNHGRAEEEVEEKPIIDYFDETLKGLLSKPDSNPQSLSTTEY